MIRPGSWAHTGAIVAITAGILMLIGAVTGMVGVPYGVRVAAVTAAGVAAAVYLCVGDRARGAWWAWRGRRSGYNGASVWHRTRGR